jgi:hypothetical protein
MANRSYLYSLSNRPTSFADRPETIRPLSEWPYSVPFSYRVLMSGDPELCASLISDGFEDEPTGDKTRLHAVSSSFEPGFGRLQKLCAVLRQLASEQTPELVARLDETERFLEQHRDRYLLLETIELDTVAEEGGPDLRSAVKREIVKCRRAGEAVDALSSSVAEATVQLKSAARQRPGKPWWKWWARPAPLEALYGLRLDDDFDNTRDRKTPYPIGLSGWTDVVYFQLWNREKFETERDRSELPP